MQIIECGTAVALQVSDGVICGLACSEAFCQKETHTSVI